MGMASPPPTAAGASCAGLHIVVGRHRTEGAESAHLPKERPERNPEELGRRQSASAAASEGLFDEGALVALELAAQGEIDERRRGHQRRGCAAVDRQVVSK